MGTLLPRMPSKLLPHSTDTMVTMATTATHMLVPLLPTLMVLLSQLTHQPKCLPRTSTLLPRVPSQLLPHSTETMVTMATTQDMQVLMLMELDTLHMHMATQESTPLATMDWFPTPTVPLSQLSLLMLLKPARSTWLPMLQHNERTI